MAMALDHFPSKFTMDRAEGDEGRPTFLAILAERDKLDHARRRVNPEAYAHQRGQAIPLVVERHQHDRGGVTIPIGVGAGPIVFLDREHNEIEDARAAQFAAVRGSLYDTQDARDFESIVSTHRQLGVGGASVGSEVATRNIRRGARMDRQARALGASLDVLRADAREVAYVWEPSLGGNTFEIDRDGSDLSGEYDRELARLTAIQPFTETS